MRLKTIILILVAMTGLSIYADRIEISKVTEDYTRHIYIDSINVPMPYRLLKPEEPIPGKSYPLVVFLHGAGESGYDNEKQLTHGATLFNNPANADRYPAFVLFPQCKGKTWTVKPHPKNFMPGAEIPPESEVEQVLMSLIRNLEDEYPIDRNRIYLMGISMGGIATYDLACRHPDIFTAAVPICGAVNPDRLKEAEGVNFMIFHGSADRQIPVVSSRLAYKTLDSLGAEVQYIEYSGIGHDCWDEAFNEPDLLPWLFSQTKHSPTHEETATVN